MDLRDEMQNQKDHPKKRKTKNASKSTGNQEDMPLNKMFGTKKKKVAKSPTVDPKLLNEISKQVVEEEENQNNRVNDEVEPPKEGEKQPQERSKDARKEGEKQPEKPSKEAQKVQSKATELPKKKG
ncbi:microtubule-associated protein 1B-like [Chenopodium quinoa]|uniref:microtubule-associated protein 1B-like n=1 Tax=Chenopodium quinoa TaxID=63459 RepID=UPI000B785E35|nr:microtubule-associated protein 1B-like [Chenopodium quinoa]